MIDIVHVGLHKTGSTWLQRVVFPHCAQRFYLDDRHRHFARHIIQMDDGCLYSVNELLTKHPQGVLWSCEDLSGLLQGPAERSRIVERLTSVLREPGVIAVVRSQAQLIPSLYAQYIKLGGTRSFEASPLSASMRMRAFLHGQCAGFRFRLDDFDFHLLLQPFVRRFGRSRALVLPYELLTSDREAFLSRLSRFCGEQFEVERDE